MFLILLSNSHKLTKHSYIYIPNTVVNVVISTKIYYKLYFSKFLVYISILSKVLLLFLLNFVYIPEKMYHLFHKKYEAVQLFSTLLIIINQQIRMISEGLCDSEDWSNDADNSALHHRNNLHLMI